MLCSYFILKIFNSQNELKNKKFFSFILFYYYFLAAKIGIIGEIEESFGK